MEKKEGKNFILGEDGKPFDIENLKKYGYTEEEINQLIEDLQKYELGEK